MTVSLTTAELAKYIDATALKADTSEADVRRLVAESREAGVKSVCINPVWVPLVAAELAGSDVLTCTVIGFPLGANASEVKAFEARQAIDAGADEVDMVIDVAAARAGDRQRLVEDIRAEATRRQDVARRILPAGSFAAHGQGHHIWLRLPVCRSATGFAAQSRRFGLALVPDTAFAVGPAPDAAVRISLGAAPDLDCLAAALGRIGSLLDENADALAEIV